MLLNLHCHSNYSDGANSIFELASAYKNSGHIALCLTDHNQDFIVPDQWLKQREEAAQVSAELDFPIIVGLECFVPNFEEILIFGSAACLSAIAMADITSINAFNGWCISQKEPFAMILAHPSLHKNEADFYALMDGYEIMNGGLAWRSDFVEKMKILMPPPRRAYKNQDLHSLTDIDLPCNEVEDLILKNETDLIKYLSVKEW